MPWTTGMRLRRFALSDSRALLFMLWVPMALAAEQTVLKVRAIERDWGDNAFWWTFGAVQVLWIIGYLSSSLPAWANWSTADGKTRLTVIAGIFCALIAGNVAYYLSYYEMNWPTLYCFFGAIGGGFLGEKYLTPLFQRLMPMPAAPKGGDTK